VNNAKLQFYSDFTGFGLNFEILKILPFRAVEIKRYHKNCFLIKGLNQVALLWVHQGREESLTDQIDIINHCQKNGFAGFLEFILLKDGSLYGKIDDRSYFYLTELPELQKFYYHNILHLKSAVKLIAEFQDAASNWIMPTYLQRLKEKLNLLGKMNEMTAYLDAFRMLAMHRVNPTRFDKIFLEKLPLIEESAATAVGLTAESKYHELLAESRINGIIINDWSRSNLGVGPQHKIRLLHLNNFCCELPIIDLAVLLLKSGRSNGWSMQWFESLCEEYQRNIPVSQVEFAIIKAYLTFPWNLYRLANRYYLNRVEWPLYYFIEKLERLIKDEENRIKLIKQLS